MEGKGMSAFGHAGQKVRRGGEGEKKSKLEVDLVSHVFGERLREDAALV